MKQFATACTKHDGKLKLLDREAFDLGFAQFGDGEDLELHVEAIGRKRTHAQNRFFHGPVLKAFMKLGYGQQEAKDMLCLLFIPQEIELPDGSIVRVPGHTSAQDVAGMTDLIENAIRLAAEEGEPVEDAEDWLRKQREAA